MHNNNLQTFPSTATAGNITFDSVNASITYYFRVSAVVFVNGTTDEGEHSSVTDDTTVHIPYIEVMITSPDLTSAEDALSSGALIGMVVGITVGVVAVTLLVVLIVVMLIVKNHEPKSFKG